MNDCPYQPAGSQFRCPHCGHTTRFANLRRNCPKLTVETVSAEVPPSPRKRCNSKPTQSLLALGWNLATFAVRWAKRGLQTASPALYEARKATCEACPLYDADQGVCTSCGCFVRLKAALVAHGKADCPESYWPDT